MDVVRVTTPVVAMQNAIESFMIFFEKVSSNSLELMIIWGKTAVSLPIKVDIDTKIMSQIDNLMNADNRPYFNAAMYYMDNNKDLNKAAEWLDKATAQTPNAYWVWYQKAVCLNRLGKKAEAMTASKKSLELAIAGKNPDYVTLNEKLQASLK
jgi:tetratricopeptide (TPR) repeat protein